MESQKIHPLLKPYFPLVRGLAAILGKHCEVLLHDVSQPDHSIVACENGHVTGRGVGCPMTDFGLLMLTAEEYRDKDGVFNYLARTQDGRLLKCGVVFLRDGEGRIIGFLCINMDASKYQAAREMLDDLFRVEMEEIRPGAVRERFSRDLDDLVEETLGEVRIWAGRPLAALSRGEKVEAVRRLQARGFFLLKGAVEVLAREMGKTKYTIYAYLREGREAKGEAPAS
ncbi:helix-turn-helix transcriptional regulator [Aminomonas paucivorans]|uniref:helix-turn-helix transcriptional regulator n=1 Tax=Aminomonas paucivorans TaxID=81412 RepID=UPI00332DF9C1